MQRIPFVALPFWTKLAVMLVPFSGWIMFAEFVIDRNGWDRFLPFYRLGQFCPYEVIVLSILGLIWWRLEQRAKQDETTRREVAAAAKAATGRCC
uniref:hypothetical protein n=1 Tax=Parerythrobacter lutipelagi TaxID=1964208 RepID=UPI0010F6CEA6|nr:hypothetical protein [Parerythrobacter lutipelagi]